MATRSLAAFGAAALVVASGHAAVALPDDDSEALGEVLALDVAGLDLAGLASTASGNPSSPGPHHNPINADILGIGVNAPGLEIPLFSEPGAGGLIELGELGLLGSYASSPSETESTASAGVISDDGGISVTPGDDSISPASVNLTDLLAQLGIDGLTDEILDQASLELGAFASQAEISGEDVESEYALADARLVLNSPAVGGVC
ncbi:choice-of-anchor G family protein [Sediminivirga luteola]|uniref:choice-of-anchor G family protein n=1 Tax=Sediminivirga luteola TaxID=1774748 RepID=UPI001F55DDD5|nr:choice-of-anchor G family protein [Sediminivirga luteola]MCI2266687.1 choice-of-anchor G family protein [Sediminivirga luteola]